MILHGRGSSSRFGRLFPFRILTTLREPPRYGVGDSHTSRPSGYPGNRREPFRLEHIPFLRGSGHFLRPESGRNASVCVHVAPP